MNAKVPKRIYAVMSIVKLCGSFVRKTKKKPEDAESKRIAAEIMRLSQGTPVVGYHDENGHLVIPAGYDDEYRF